MGTWTLKVTTIGAMLRPKFHAMYRYMGPRNPSRRPNETFKKLRRTLKRTVVEGALVVIQVHGPYKETENNPIKPNDTLCNPTRNPQKNQSPSRIVVAYEVGDAFAAGA